MEFRSDMNITNSIIHPHQKLSIFISSDIHKLHKQNSFLQNNLFLKNTSIINRELIQPTIQQVQRNEKLLPVDYVKYQYSRLFTNVSSLCSIYNSAHNEEANTKHVYLPRDFFFSWSYIITISWTFPYRLKIILKSVSVMLEGNPPRKTLGKVPPFFFCIERGVHALGSI